MNMVATEHLHTHTHTHAHTHTHTRTHTHTQLAGWLFTVALLDHGQQAIQRQHFVLTLFTET